MPEPYAVRIDQKTGGKKYYKTKKDYQAGRFQATGTMSAQRERINRKIGGLVV